MNKEVLIALSFPFLLIKDAKASEPVRVESNNHSLPYKNGLNYLPYLNGASNDKVK